jgi:hypothetical protein
MTKLIVAFRKFAKARNKGPNIPPLLSVKINQRFNEEFKQFQSDSGVIMNILMIKGSY